MTTSKAIIFTLCYIIVILLVHIVVTPEPTVSVHNITYEDKIVVGNKLIERKQLERLVNTITSSPKTEAFAKRFGIEIIPAPPELILQLPNNQETTYDLQPNKNKEHVDPLLTNMIEEVEEFFEKQPGLAYRSLRCYQNNKRSNEFWEKVKNFVKEN